MENNISHSNIVFHTVKMFGSSLRKHFAKAAITIILFSASAYILKTLGFIAKVKKFVHPKENTLASNTKTINVETNPVKKANVSPEIKEICEQTGCEPEDLFRVSKEDYESLTDHIKSKYKYKDHLMKILERYSRKDVNGNAFFIGERGLAAYSHSIISSQYQEGEKHALAGHYIDKIVRVPINHEFFPEVKNMGSPAPRVNDAYAISNIKFKKFVERKAREEYGDNANYLSITNLSVKSFEKILSDNGHKVEDCDYKVLGKFGMQTYILLPEGAKEKYCDCLYMASANKTTIDIKNISHSSGCNIRDIVKLSKESYKKLIDKVKSCKFKSILMPLLEKHSLTGESDNVFFAGDEAISILCKALVSSERVRHSLEGFHPENILHINERHKSFNSLKELGAQVPLVESEYVINVSGVKDIVKKEALEHYKEGAEWAWFDKTNFNIFKKRASENSDFILVQEIDDSFFIALPPGSKEKFPDIGIFSAKTDK